MPIYGYRCTQCGHELEILQSMTDPPLRTCPECMGPLQKQLYPVGVHFKGSGFYTTDYKNGDRRAQEKSPEKSQEKSQDQPEQTKKAQPAAGESKKPEAGGGAWAAQTEGSRATDGGPAKSQQPDSALRRE